MRLAIAVVVAACGQPAAPAQEPAPAPARVDDDGPDHLRWWRALSPTYERWSIVRASIRDEDRKMLARSILRAGGFACPARIRPPAGCDAPVRMGVPDDRAGVDDPCMRRLIATWAVRQLDDDELAALGDALVPIATLPGPETMLNTEVVTRVTKVDPVRGRALAWLAALRPHGGIGPLDLRTDGAWLTAAIANTASSPDERMQAIDRLSGLVPDGTAYPKEIRAALIAAAAAPSCAVAITAATELAAHGEPGFLPRRPLTTSVDDASRALCMAAAEGRREHRDARAALFVAFHGPGSPALTIRTEAGVTAYERAAPYTGGENVLARCRGETCDDGRDRAKLVFTPAPDGGLYLTSVVIWRNASACFGTAFGPGTATRPFDDRDYDASGIR